MSGVVTNVDPNFAPAYDAVGPSALLEPSSTRLGGDETFKKTVTKLIGKNIQTHGVLSGAIDLRQGYPHSTTGIPQAISGTASQVQIDVADALASFQDPIRALLGTGVHQDQKILIRRRYVVGGSASIVPERAPARTVSVREDVRQIMLTRYGGDLEMNLNLFLRPGDAQRELKMKLDAQKRALETALIEIGYETIMKEGIRLPDAIVRSNPSYSGKGGKEAAERIMVHQLFGAMAKQEYPITNLMASAKYASVYSTTGDKGSVLLLPHGCPELHKYTKPTEMEYSITGLSKNQIEPVSIPLTNVYRDPTTNVKIVTHVPRANLDMGAANPRASVGGLTDEVTIQMHYSPARKIGAKDVNVFAINFNTQTLEDTFQQIGEDGTGLPASGNRNTAICNGENRVIFRKAMKFVMSSGVLVANPGSETGELLIGYPFSAVSTSQSTEQMTIKLRCYLGAGIYRPENVLILPHIAFEGLDADHANVKDNFEAFNAPPSLQKLLMAPMVDMDAVAKAMTDNVYESNGTGTAVGTVPNATPQLPQHFKTAFKKVGSDYVFNTSQDWYCRRIYRGYSATNIGGTETLTTNTGHLGEVDSVEFCNRVWGTAGGQIYKPRVQTTKHITVKP